MSLIYPRLCEACGLNLFGHEKHICNLCKINLRKSHYHLQPNNPISNMLAGRIPVQNAGACWLFEKNGKVQNILHSIKYKNNKELAIFAGTFYAEELKQDNAYSSCTLIIPIPLHERKFKQRGFNQSELFAKGLSEGLNIPMNSDLLSRLKETATQTRKKKFERWENVEGIFEVKNKTPLINQHILLVDDVITTGATLEAAWTCLKEIEGIQISIASIAFADKV